MASQSWNRASTARVHTFFTDLVQVTDDELEALVRLGAPERAAEHLPVFLDELAQAGPRGLSDPAVLDHLVEPVLLLHGSRSHPFWRDVADQLGRQLVRADVREIADVEHFAPLVAPAPVAAELDRFFLAALR